MRAHYGDDPSHKIGINYVAESDEPLWVAIPDLVFSALQRGQAPRVQRAYRFYPGGAKAAMLKPIRLRGQVEVDPRTDDFFKVVIEQRMAARRRRQCGSPKGCLCEDCRLVEFLKVLANAGSYGIWVEFNRKEEKATAERSVYGTTSQPWTTSVDRPEEPGKFNFPPIGTLITSAARLMLGMLECLVVGEGGVWAMCDTDSMFIVAAPKARTINGAGSVPIPVLSYGVVERIRHRFNDLNPYDPAVTGHLDILKREYPDDLDGDPVFFYGISAKRYALFTMAGDHIDVLGIHDDSNREANDDIDLFIVENKEHGLGVYLNPVDPSRDDSKGQRGWVTEVWTYLIRRDMGPDVQEPGWFSRPAMVKLPISTWDVYKAFSVWNEGKLYKDQIKPYGFAMTAKALDFQEGGAKPPGNGWPFRLVAPLTSDPSRWADLEFWNIYEPTGGTYRIAMPGQPNDPDRVWVSTYRSVIASYLRHPEDKFVDSHHNPCTGDTRGLLHRQQVRVVGLTHIGKESNKLEERDYGLVTEVAEIQNDYGSGRDDFQQYVVPLLKERFSTRKLADRVADKGVSVTHQHLSNILRGSTPRPKLRDALTEIAVERAFTELGNDIPNPEWRRSREIRLRQWCEILATWQQRFLAPAHR